MTCRLLGPVDITIPLAALSTTVFLDTGGTNGHLATPDWLPDFVRGLHLPGHLMQAVVRKLPAGQGIPPHVDPMRPHARRFHVPLVTHPAVRMAWPDDHVSTHLAAGLLYEVRVDDLHEIVNHAPIDRVHVVVDVIDVPSP